MKPNARIIFIVVLAVILAGALIGATPAQPAHASGTYHVVLWGQTLYDIALWYGVNVWTLACANGLYNANYIYAGQVLYIPYGSAWYGGYGCVPTYPAPSPYPYPGPYGCTYRVRWGDTLSGIAWRYHTSVSALTYANHIWNPNFIYAGQLLRLPGCYW
jgi:lysozyme